MRLGVVLPAELGRSADPVWLSDMTQQVEALGYDEISVVEHTVVVSGTTSRYPYSPTGRSPLPDECPLPDPLEMLAFIAGKTRRLGLATGVLVLPNHHPVVLAKRLATVDQLSAGRLRVCLGLGWMQEEVQACGGDFTHRGSLADEAITAMRALWAPDGEAGATFAGPTYPFARAHCSPTPVRPAGVPLYIGGHSLAAARRAGRLGNGFQPLGLVGDDLTDALAVMRAAAATAGRSPEEVRVVLGSTLGRVDHERIERARRLGATRILLSAAAGMDSADQFSRQLVDCADRLGLAA